MNFSEMNINETLVNRLKNMGIVAPTEIQLKIIPPILAGKDIIAESETGSGKTLGFAVPIVHAMKREGFVQAIILAPTRELAQQIGKEFDKIAAEDVFTSTVYGGAGMDKQMREVKQADIVVGTPGRVLDLIQRGCLNLGRAKIVVLDEADRMLDMGFVEDLEKILSFVPKQRQTMLLSATMAKEVVRLAHKYLHEPQEFRVDADIKGRALKQTYYLVNGREKPMALALLLKASGHELALIFCRTKRGSENLTRSLARYGIKAKYLNGDLPQNRRERIVEEFKDFNFRVLVATDVASRGLHIDFVTHVYNYEIPDQLENYIHRVGRTARAGKSGEAISLVAEQDFQYLRPIRSYFEGKIEQGDLNKIAEQFPEALKEIQNPTSVEYQEEAVEDRGHGGGFRRGGGHGRPSGGGFHSSRGGGMRHGGGERRGYGGGHREGGSEGQGGGYRGHSGGGGGYGRGAPRRAPSGYGHGGASHQGGYGSRHNEAGTEGGSSRPASGGYGGHPFHSDGQGRGKGFHQKNPTHRREGGSGGSFRPRRRESRY